ncbi:DUF4340 domain-containing protein [Patescibacteria group bacterium]|nr:DUF4340 domain-containing protein [Patescibacteria group bacterium]
MSKKLIITFAVIFLLLGLIVLYPFIENRNTNNKTKIDTNFLVGINLNLIEKIRIKSIDEDEILLEKDDDLWSVNGFQADKEIVNNFLNSLKNIKVDKIVSKNPSNHKEFLLGNDLGKEIIIIQEDNIISFLTGKKGVEYNSVYLRWPNQDEVYLVKTNINDFLIKQSQEWENKDINVNTDKNID